MKYKIISGDTIEILTRKVNEYLTKGWQLNGGLQIAHGKWRVSFHQAMSLVPPSIHDGGVGMHAVFPELTPAQTREFGTQP